MDPQNYRRTPPPVDELPLFAAPPAPTADPAWLIQPLSRIERDFQRFHSQNPHVYADIERRALGYLASGARRIGIAKIIEDLRHDPTLRTKRDGYKIDNDHRALYARLLIHRKPEVAAILATRERREKGGAAA